MTESMPYKVGQEVWIYPISVHRSRVPNLKPTRMVVDKVGRKYITCKYSSESTQGMKFDIVTGLEYCGDYSSENRVYPSLEALWDDVDKENAVKAIRKLTHPQLEALSLEQLSKACDILGTRYERCNRNQ